MPLLLLLISLLTVHCWADGPKTLCYHFVAQKRLRPEKRDSTIFGILTEMFAPLGDRSKFVISPSGNFVADLARRTESFYARPDDEFLEKPPVTQRYFLLRHLDVESQTLQTAKLILDGEYSQSDQSEPLSHGVFSPDGRRLVVAGRCRTKKADKYEGDICTLYTQYEIGLNRSKELVATKEGTFSVQQGDITDLSFSRDGVWLQAATVTTGLYFWDMSLGKKGEVVAPTFLGRMVPDYGMDSMAHVHLSSSPSRKLVAAVSRYSQVEIWRVDGRPKWSQNPLEIRDPTTTPDSVVRGPGLFSGAAFVEVLEDLKPVSAICFLDDSHLAIGHMDGSIGSYHVGTGKYESFQKTKFDDGINGESNIARMSLSKDGRLLIVELMLGGVVLYDIKTRKIKKMMLDHPGTRYSVREDQGFVLSEDNAYAVTLRLPKVITLWPLNGRGGRAVSFP